jgi:N utilization substance protein A
VKEVRIDPRDKTALVIVPDYQLSLAIGKEGQNARLAARLTGWRVDIKSESQFAQDQARRTTPPASEAAPAEAAEAAAPTEVTSADVVAPAAETPAEVVAPKEDAPAEAEAVSKDEAPKVEPATVEAGGETATGGQ